MSSVGKSTLSRIGKYFQYANNVSLITKCTRKYLEIKNYQTFLCIMFLLESLTRKNEKGLGTFLLVQNCVQILLPLKV